MNETKATIDMIGRVKRLEYSRFSSDKVLLVMLMSFNELMSL